MTRDGAAAATAHSVGAGYGQRMEQDWGLDGVFPDEVPSDLEGRQLEWICLKVGEGTGLGLGQGRG